MIVCLWAERWTQAEREQAAARLVRVTPRLALDAGLIWVDARGLDALQLASRLLFTAGGGVSAGVARIPIAAQVAAQVAVSAEPNPVAPGAERAFLALLPLDVLRIGESVRLLLQGVGIETCGELAALEREAVEVRFGPELLRFWQYARGEDERRLFAPNPPEPPHAAIDFVDYVVTDPERLMFSVNAMLSGICDVLHAAGRHARRMTLTLPLANGQKWERTLRPARPTGSRAVWLRLARAVLERITVADAVTGIALVADGMEAAHAVQGDLFDAGFATASAVGAALERLIEAQGRVIADVDFSRHPLAEQRGIWKLDGAGEHPDAEAPGSGESSEHRHAGAPESRGAWTHHGAVMGERGSNGSAAQPSGLTLQLLAVPREVLVETVGRRDHHVPVRYRDGQWMQLLTVAGPDRISGGRWEQSYAREYFRAVTVEGVLVWLYRDARSDCWFLHGWWD